MKRLGPSGAHPSASAGGGNLGKPLARPALQADVWRTPSSQRQGPNTVTFFTSRPLLAFWCLALALTAVLGLTAAAAPPTQHHVDKLIHMTVFGGLAAVPVAGFRNRAWALGAALALIPFGGLIELGQELVPGRTGSLGDAAANTLGVLAGIAAGWVLRRLRNRPQAA